MPYKSPSTDTSAKTRRPVGQTPTQNGSAQNGPLDRAARKDEPSGYDPARDHATFEKDLVQSRKAVLVAARWLTRRGTEVTVPPFDVRESVEDRYDYQDAGDLFVQRPIGVRVLSESFSGAGSFPYRDVLLARKERHDENDVPFYFVFSRDLRYCLIASRESCGEWTTRSSSDRPRTPRARVAEGGPKGLLYFAPLRTCVAAEVPEPFQETCPPFAGPERRLRKARTIATRWLRSRGEQVILMPRDKPFGSNSRGETDCSEGPEQKVADLTASVLRPIEVKRRGVEFSGPASFPYSTFYVNEKYKHDQEQPLYYLVFSQSLRSCAIVDSRTEPDWKTTQKRDAHRGRSATFYTAPLELCHFTSVPPEVVSPDGEDQASAPCENETHGSERRPVPPR